MGYYNPIYIYGVERFLADAKAAGVDGLIVVDLPPEEDDELCLPAIKAGLNFIRLATPTTDDKRAPAVLRNTVGLRLLCLGARHHRHQGARSQERRAECHPPARATPACRSPSASASRPRSRRAHRQRAPRRRGRLRPRQRGQGQPRPSAGKPTPKTVKAVHALVSEIAQGVRS